MGNHDPYSDSYRDKSRRRRGGNVGNSACGIAHTIPSPGLLSGNFFLALFSGS